MSIAISKYKVEEIRMSEYLKKRFIYVSIKATFLMVTAFSMLTFVLYKQNAIDGIWSYLFSAPIILIALVIGLIRWNTQLSKLTNTEYILTNDSLTQKAPFQSEKNFKFSTIVVIDEQKFGTNIVKGNWLSKINYYRPKKSPFQINDPQLIFIPSITSNYNELIELLKQAKYLNK
jgi:hypothetical protein